MLLYVSESFKLNLDRTKKGRQGDDSALVL